MPLRLPLDAGFVCPVALRLGDRARGQFQPSHLMCQDSLLVGSRLCTSQGAFHGVRHALGDFLAFRHPAAPAHFLLLPAIEQEVRRLIARRTAQRQHLQARAQPAA